MKRVALGYFGALACLASIVFEGCSAEAPPTSQRQAQGASDGTLKYADRRTPGANSVAILTSWATLTCDGKPEGWAPTTLAELRSVSSCTAKTVTHRESLKRELLTQFVYDGFNTKLIPDVPDKDIVVDEYLPRGDGTLCNLGIVNGAREIDADAATAFRLNVDWAQSLRFGADRAPKGALMATAGHAMLGEHGERLDKSYAVIFGFFADSIDRQEHLATFPTGNMYLIDEVLAAEHADDRDYAFFTIDKGAEEVHPGFVAGPSFAEKDSLCMLAHPAGLPMLIAGPEVLEEFRWDGYTVSTTLFSSAGSSGGAYLQCSGVPTEGSSALSAIGIHVASVDRLKQSDDVNYSFCQRGPNNQCVLPYNEPLDGIGLPCDELGGLCVLRENDPKLDPSSACWQPIRPSASLETYSYYGAAATVLRSAMQSIGFISPAHPSGNR